MSTPARISLRLLGLVLLLVGMGAIVLLFVPGPDQVAKWMGNSCVHTTNGPHEQCSIFDVLDFVGVAPVLIFAGLILVAAMRPPHKGPATIDLRRGSH